MDQLAALLDGPRARGAFMLRCLLDPPWSLRIQDEAPLTGVVMVRGEGWVEADEGDFVRLCAEDVPVVRGPKPYRLADCPATPPQIVIHPGQHCTTVDGDSLAQAM